MFHKRLRIIIIFFIFFLRYRQAYNLQTHQTKFVDNWLNWNYENQSNITNCIAKINNKGGNVHIITL